MVSEGIYRRFAPGVTEPEVQGSKAYAFACKGTKILVEMKNGTICIPSMEAIQRAGIVPVRRQFLGTLDDIECYSLELNEGRSAPEGMVLQELRSLLGVMEDELFLLCGRAVQIVNWDSTHQYCGRCGSPTRTKKGERAKECTACGLIQYPRISPAIIVAVTNKDKILLAHAKHFQNSRYSVIAGFVEPGETFEDCVRREVFEEVGIEIKNIRYFGSQPWPFPHSLMVAFTAEYDKGDIRVDGIEIEDAGWFKWDSLPVIPSKGSISRQLIDWFVERQTDFSLSSQKNGNTRKYSAINI